MDLSSNDNVPLEEDSNDISNGPNHINEHLVKYIEKNKSNLKDIETVTKQITVDLMEAKDKIVKLFDTLEKEVDQVGDKLHQDENNNKSRENSQCQSLPVAVRQSYQLLDAVKRMGNKLFITARQVKAQLANYTEQVVKKYRKLETKGVGLTFNKTLKILLSKNNKMLATVHTKDKTEELSLTGIIKTPCIELMIKELASPIRENDSLYTEFQHVSHYRLSSSPWNVCMVDEGEVAISLPSEKKIQFLAYDAPVTPARRITARLYCDGLVVLSKNKVVISVYNDTGNQNYYWSILTTSGKEKTYNEIGQKGGIWTYLAMNKSKTRLFMSCYDIDTVLCFGLDGHMYFKYKDERLVRPVAFGVDVDGKVYVAGNCSGNIHQVSPQGSQLQIVGCKIPTRPLQIAFLQNGSRFLVTSEWGVECSFFRLH
ncbi:hypothetical protein CHS0354_021953 [Potamilus streckersoni]|uniref:Uncharacterized protein n=1 Tax=Potamilus streckersoni TaxID=2493646 RepID=A0AAE0SKF4_9BIVA|nr:hypothetical protein CHS0354_021953 [Potamilus streckersoni]